ncbi:NlpC/P60 family protein [Streptomyces sp. NPDC008313]|uniref:C40 family peptidase n=1 Tax=Streptomyces sp. NPDC008313 TaxID=3364826 RepID=UPI0036EDCBB6
MGIHRRLAPTGFDRGAGAAVCVLSAAAAALGTLPATAAPEAPGDDTPARVDHLYEQAERATEAYDKADAHADRLRAQVNAAQDGLAHQQGRVNTLRDELGSLAGAQYRSGGLDEAVALLFSDDPDDYLERASVLDRIGARQAGRLGDLERALRELAQDRAEATDKLLELEESRKAVARHKRTVERKLAQARLLLNSLPAARRAAYAGASRSGRPDMPGPVGDAPSSARAAAALAAARSALGRPYVWGANGPGGFDCSGLVQWSYGQAGVGLPRTSQAQRYAGRRVPLSQARPGDLIAYRDDASHIAMYAGDGRVIHAPYPGAPVRYDRVDMMPVSSVTRV